MTAVHGSGRSLSRRTFLAGAGSAATIGALTVAGCATSAPPAPATPAAPPVGPQTIKFYGNTLGEEAQKAAWQTVVDGWQQTSGNKIEPVIYPYEQAATQLALAGRGGQFAGVGQAGPWEVLVPVGVLADLSDIAEAVDIPQQTLDTLRVDGTLYMLPNVSAGIGMVADGRITQSVGITGGMSTDAFAAALESIKKQDPDVIPYAAVTKNPDLKDAAHWMWGWGSEVVAQDLTCTIGDEASVAAITWYKGLQDAGLIKANVARTDARVLFGRGQAAMYDDAPIANTFVRTNSGTPELQAAITPIARPRFGGKPSYNRWWGNGLFASSGPTEAASKDFIRYVMTDVAAATALYKQSAVAPANKKVADQIPELASDPFQTAFRTEISENARVSAWDKLPVKAQIDTFIGESVAGILAGQSEVQAGLNDLRGKVQGLLDANR